MIQSMMLYAERSDDSYSKVRAIIKKEQFKSLGTLLWANCNCTGGP